MKIDIDAETFNKLRSVSLTLNSLMYLLDDAILEVEQSFEKDELDPFFALFHTLHLSHARIRANQGRIDVDKMLINLAPIGELDIHEELAYAFNRDRRDMEIKQLCQRLILCALDADSTVISSEDWINLQKHFHEEIDNIVTESRQSNQNKEN